MGADVLHHRRSDHDAADRVSGQPVWAQAALSRRDRRLHRRLHAVRRRAIAHPSRPIPHPAGRLRRGAGTAVPVGADEHLPAREAGIRDGAVRLGVMAGPILGPVLGGWLTEYYSWRWVFYINLPVGVLGFIGLSIFMPESRRNASEKLDWFGFATLSIAIGALQIMLDRGEQL